MESGNMEKELDGLRIEVKYEADTDKKCFAHYDDEIIFTNFV